MNAAMRAFTLFLLAVCVLADDAVQKAFRAPLRSVMDKTDVAPSGDRHDFLSYGPYWWPNPATKDGLPYIRKDGYRNLEIIQRGDSDNFSAMAHAVMTLAKSGEKRHHENAALRLRTWFLTPATRMTPHLDYGQAIPGKTKGRGAGLILMRHLIGLLDALPRLGSAWTSEDDRAMKTWMTDYVRWLTTSEVGREERAAPNNHGSWYAAQAMRIHLYLGDRKAARAIAEQLPARMEKQIAATGQQPLETERQDGISYSLFNLEALVTAAVVAQPLELDLFDHEALQRAVDYLKPFVNGSAKWPFRQNKKLEAEELAKVIRLAGGRLR
jgi:Alginate lyase